VDIANRLQAVVVAAEDRHAEAQVHQQEKDGQGSRRKQFPEQG
jgi:hypothetical protein